MKKNLIVIGLVISAVLIFVIGIGYFKFYLPTDIKREGIAFSGNDSKLTGTKIQQNEPISGVITDFVVNGMSMYPTFRHGESIKAILFTSGESKAVNRYDIVVVKFKTISKPLIKRVIGLPGDVIDFSGGKLFINGEEEKRDYMYPSNHKYTADQIRVLKIQLSNFGGKIPQNMYLVLGDNRSDSNDSRRFGLVDKKQIIGKVTNTAQ